jgi:nitric oxide reductase subunit C
MALLVLGPARPAVGAAAGPAFDGKKLFVDKGCFACHSVNGPSAGPGPELTQVAYQRDAAWLRAWLTDPKKIKKDTVMPKLPWKSQAEQDALIDYLLSARHPIPAADSTDGQKLVGDYLCTACHAIHHKGGKPQFPDLANVAKTRDAAYLDHWLKDPQAVKKGTFMATFPLTPTQRHSIVDYIGTLNKK